ncbi:restriction endonuclease subunit S [Campylobacter upsaliensis]|uniref:Restriction endonuclease subunit S n=1 Tax=Campylobacter upsaliensis TaxID=28080 RepID=A0A5M1DX73_CAMUP|nr:restriction endonuclease subunit S [Campylobacter upsaliensis]ECV9719163.1 restriction endonuclease subunit S [Campylobacter upsaliensis]EDP6896718.1 restriction endonuclease subunit S [Campylobacter upsaliensis]MBT0803267.1 restriction endonuclease subunit S [Campylobacter upsaliensis]
MRVYKPSGIEWLGEIPQSWEIKPLQAIFNQRNEQNNNLEFQTILSLVKDVGVIPYEEKGNVGNKAKDDLQGYKIARVNDLVLNKMNAVIGSLGVSKYDGLVSPIYLVLYIENPNYLIAYYSYLFQTKSIQKFLRKFAYGIMEIRESIDYLEFKKMFLPTPPLQEQKEIAEFLDSKCEKIQNYIEKKQKLITLLQEKKQALINEAVCGRVACHTERSEVSTTAYKPSGIEYLGLIPHHWEVARSGLIYKNISSGTTPQSDNDEYYKNGNIFWINSGDLNDSVLTNSKNKITQKAMMAYSALKISPKGSLIIAMYGATIGKVSILGIDACTNQACCVLCESKYLNTRFVFYYFIAKRQDLISMAYGGGQPNISQDIIKNFKIPLPLLQEQKQIANFLDEKCEKINSVIEKTKKQIELVKEYKNTFINEAVCGRIRVN